jgi:S1-C subfamily serine protease
MANLNSVVQIIVSEPGAVAYQKMVAGSGWFPNPEKHNVPEGTILTNAHVVHNASSVFIRIPAKHTIDIPVYVHGISTDLDLAVIRLDTDEIALVKSILKEQYNVNEIPSLNMADSDSVHPTNYSKMNAPRVISRGYPLGTEYQQFTDGRVSGLKHANEQEYIVTTATINPGNSGGPLVHENDEVIGINSMKMTNAEGINMVIPSNRIKAVLPTLMDNSENKEELERLMQMSMLMNAGLSSRAQVEYINALLIPDVEHIQLASYWNKNNAGGFKKSKGIVTPVLMSDWFNKHVNGKTGAHALFSKVLTHLHNEEIDEIVKMRSDGFQTYLCENCAAGDCEQLNVKASLIPPKSMHMPILGFTSSNSSGDPTLYYYGNPKNVSSGIIISNIVKGSSFERAGVQKGDFLHKLSTKRGKFKVDNYGESWMSHLSVSLPVADIIHRTPFGETIDLHVVNLKGNSQIRQLHYNFLEDKHKPHIRLLDTLHDAPLAKQMLQFKGIVLKQLRLNDVMQFQLQKYSQAKHHHEFKIVVADIDVRSPAFHTRNLRPGHILSKINDEEVPTSWNGFVEVLQQIKETDVTLFETENGSMLII